MRRNRCFFWRAEMKIIGLVLLILGISIIGILILPYKLWLIIIGFLLIYLGYKLFC
ncbi:MAG: hypothetical protein GX285_10860 [Clostridiales bacterium]|nr:hypothetical protein [Clostridiales bacterium]